MTCSQSKVGAPFVCSFVQGKGGGLPPHSRPLDKYRPNFSTPSTTASNRLPLPEPLELLRAAQAKGLLPGTACLSRALPNEQATLSVSDKGRSRWGGLCRCGRQTCPNCALIDGKTHAERIGSVLVQHWGGEVATPGGRGAYLLSLTAPHHRGDDPERLMDWLTRAWARLVGGRSGALRREAFQLACPELPEVTGWVASTEGMESPVNGPHPHFHVLVLTEANHPGLDFENLDGDDVWERWRGAYHTMLRAARSGTPSFSQMDDDVVRMIFREARSTPGALLCSYVWAHWQAALLETAFDEFEDRKPSYHSQSLVACTSLRGLHTYFAKLALELGKGSRKVGRGSSWSLFELLAHASGYDVRVEPEFTREEAAAKWFAWVNAFHHRKLVRWSGGSQHLRKLYPFEVVGEDGIARRVVDVDVFGVGTEDPEQWREVARVSWWHHAVLRRLRCGSDGVPFDEPDGLSEPDEPPDPPPEGPILTADVVLARCALSAPVAVAYCIEQVEHDGAVFGLAAFAAAGNWAPVRALVRSGLRRLIRLLARVVPRDPLLFDAVSDGINAES